MLPAPETARTCADPSGRRLLFRYTAREASEFEQRAFERHMLECDLCYEDFLAVWRVGEIVEDWPQDAVDSVDTSRSVDIDSTEVLPERSSSTDRTPLVHVVSWVGIGILAGLVLGTCL